mmetsp:Transcript_89405/g.239601  ORF Transcript_89405/g.239601 Transcript_89405/m.239601 type:complete len:228 (-) Transcript_89405:993-1676(-)
MSPQLGHTTGLAAAVSPGAWMVACSRAGLSDGKGRRLAVVSGEGAAGRGGGRSLPGLALPPASPPGVTSARAVQASLGNATHHCCSSRLGTGAGLSHSTVLSTSDPGPRSTQGLSWTSPGAGEPEIRSRARRTRPPRSNWLCPTDTPTGDTSCHGSPAGHPGSRSQPHPARAPCASPCSAIGSMTNRCSLTGESEKDRLWSDSGGRTRIGVSMRQSWPGGAPGPPPP